jgi:glycoprotein endo-alpha-1,2-mannosidase
MESQDWFNWSNIIREAGGHHKDDAEVRDADHGAAIPENGQGTDWALNDIINDIEHQIEEQNDALAGMTKQLEDIEVSLSLHEAIDSPVSASTKFKRAIYARMGDDDKQQQGDADQKAASTVSPASSVREIFRGLKPKSFLKKRGDTNAGAGDDLSTPREVDLATTSSSTTRQAGNAPPSISERRISVLKFGASAGGDFTPPSQASSSSSIHERLRQIEASIQEEKTDEVPASPPPLDRQVTFDMSPAKSAFFATPKHFRSSATLEESACSNTESVVSDLEETVSGKTWAIRSRGAKISVICLVLTLIMMLGLVIGQSQGEKRTQQTASKQSVNGGSDSPSPTNATFAPSIPPSVQPAVSSPASAPEPVPIAEPTSPPQVDTAASPIETPQPVAEPTEAPVSVPVVITIVAPPVEPTSPPIEATTTAPVDPPTPVPAEPEDDLSSEVTTTGYDYRANSDYLVGVYYYPWHGDNFHNGGGYMRKELQPPHQPTLGEYNDSDPAVIAQHMRWFRKANIGLLVTSWWGPNRLEDAITKDVIMVHEDVGNLKIAIHYETTGRLGDGFAELGNAKTDMEYMCEHYFDHPNYYKIDDRPVIFLYVSRVLESVGMLEEAVLTMRSTASKCGQNLYLIGDSVFESAPDPSVPHVPFWYFDAVTNYDVYGSAGRPEGYVGTDRVDNYYLQQANWKEQAMKDNCHYIPAVSPGYNDRGVRMENDHPPLSRRITSTAQEGSLFHYQLDHAKLLADENVDRMIIVNSFNEWHEDTQIEPAVGEPSTIPWNFTKGLEYVGYGELYLDILGAATSRDTSQHTIFDYLFGP